jgi:hypothetical protein
MPRYRAICPACDKRLPRRLYFHPKVSFGVVQCCHCGAAIRTNPAWEWVGNNVLAFIFLLQVATFVVLYLLLDIQLWLLLVFLATATAVHFFALGWIVFPYVTLFEAVTRSDHCRTCGYNLFGCTSRECPECGADAADIRPTGSSR